MFWVCGCLCVCVSFCFWSMFVLCVAGVFSTGGMLLRRSGASHCLL